MAHLGTTATASMKRAALRQERTKHNPEWPWNAIFMYEKKEREWGYPYVLQLCWSSCVVYVSITTAMPTMNNQQSWTGICISRLRRRWRKCNKRVIFHGSKCSSWRRPLMSQCKVVWRSSGHMHSHFISHAPTRLRFLRYMEDFSQHMQVRMTKRCILG